MPYHLRVLNANTVYRCFIIVVYILTVISCYNDIRDVIAETAN